MITHRLKLCFIALAFALVASAGHETMKGAGNSGSIEAGLGWSTSTAAKGSQWFVDQLLMKKTFDVSDKTKVVFNNMFALNSANTGPVQAPAGSGAVNNGNYYASSATLAVGGYTFSNVGAYLQHECFKNGWTSFGHIPIPLGMESMWDRYDMASYFYSPMYRFAAAMGWNYDYGMKLLLKDTVPGTLEVALYDGRAGHPNAAIAGTYPAGTGGNPGLGLAARWHNEVKNGDTSFTPVFSIMTRQFAHGTNQQNLAFTGGTSVKAGTLWGNLEFYYGTANTIGGVVKAWNVMVEPGADFGGADVSLKYALNNAKVGAGAATTDHDLGLAVGHTYNDKLRVKFAYQFMNLSGKNGTKQHDVRLLLGTKW